MSTFSLQKTTLFLSSLLLGALLLGAAPADSEEAEAEAAEPEATSTEGAEGGEGQAEAPKSRRPVMSPDQAAPAAPPPSVVRRPRETQVEEPAEPPPPLEFADEPPVALQEPAEEEEVAAVEEAEEEIADPAEVRYLTRKGNLHVEMTVKPGIPRPGEPVEIGWNLQEHLLIPDPYLGDRKPLAGVELVVSVGGPEAARVYELHPGARPGDFGFTFTPHAAGLYQLKISRRDGRAGYEAELQLPVGQPPLPPSRGLEVRRIARPASDGEVKTMMQELAKRWMHLERTAGSAEAEAAHAELVRFAESLRDGAPQQAKDAFSGLVKALGSITPQGPREATLNQMDDVNLQNCTRCHAVGRFEFAEDVSAWPAYTPNPELSPPSRRDAAGGGRRGPVRPVRQ